MVKKAKAKSQEQEPLFSGSPPNPALKGSLVMVCHVSSRFRPPAPLSSGVGRVKRQVKAVFSKRQGQRVRIVINLIVIVIL